MTRIEHKPSQMNEGNLISLEILKNLLSLQPKSPQEQFYVVDSHWMHSLESYLNNSSPFPSSIFNENLIETTDSNDFQKLKKGLIENRDFVLICDQLWSILQKQFGGGPAIVRPVIEVVILFVFIYFFPLFIFVFLVVFELVKWKISC
jgi:hypothetical protein